MDRDRKLLLVLMLPSVLIPFAVIALALIYDEFSPLVVTTVIAMFATLPAIGGGMYMWITGKGQWAISGYNTMSKTQKSYYNAEKLSKDAGKLTVVICAATLVSIVVSMGLHNYFILFAFVGVIVVFSVLISVRYSKQDRYLIDPTKTPPPPTKEERKVMWALAGVVSFTTAVILVLVFLFIGSGSVSAELTDEKLNVEAPMVHEYISYGSIETADLREGLDLGDRTMGFAGTKILSGSFSNGEFGDYTLACYKENKTYIVVKRTDGKPLVFNLASKEETAAFHHEMSEKIR